jgi:hypothetical protein
MTHLLDFAKPPRPFLLFKPDRHQVREGDTVIFQDVTKTTGEDGVEVSTTSEESVVITHVDVSSGLYKGWQLVGWNETKS